MAKVILTTMGLAALAFIVWLVYITTFADGTVFAGGFNEEHFRHIRPGMSMPQVRNILGKPLHIYKIGNKPVWDYTDWNPDKGSRYKVREVMFSNYRGRVEKTISEAHVHGC